MSFQSDNDAATMMSLAIREHSVAIFSKLGHIEYTVHRIELVSTSRGFVRHLRERESHRNDTILRTIERGIKTKQ